MTYRERYKSADNWWTKATIMELFHLTETKVNKDWTIQKTARYFTCSVGLVSENLKLAKEIYRNEEFTKCPTRKEALRKLNGART